MLSGAAAADPVDEAAGSGVDPAALYAEAVKTMQVIPQPAFATFTSTFTGEKTAFEVTRTKDGGAQISIGTGDSGARAIPTAYRRTDRLVALTLKDGIARSNSPLFDPTWAGAAAFARYGLHPPQTRSATPAPAPSDGLPVIASVGVFGVSFYRVTDLGATTCPSGSPGRSLRLVAFSSPNTHPLTAVTVDPATHRLCSMTFKLHITGAIAYAPTVELHFSSVDRYCLATDGFIDGEIHAFGFGLQHTHVKIERTALAFPPELPGTAFSDP